MTTTLCTGSIAAHTPTVQDSWVGDVLNTSRPRKNVWFRVWDLPFPGVSKDGDHLEELIWFAAQSVRCQRVLPLVDSAVGAFLAVQTQVDLTTLAAHHCSEASTADGAAAVTFAGVAEGDVSRCNPNPVVIPHPLLAMELQLAAGTLQAAAFIAFKRSLI